MSMNNSLIYFLLQIISNHMWCCLLYFVFKWYCNLRLSVLPGDVDKTEYCTVDLTEEKYQAFVYAVKNHYWYQMYIDDLPIWGKN
jgi:hypothetical protein